jgi:hypothetical protein
MSLHYKIGEGETIQYCDVMILYPYICKYFKFPVGHPLVHAGETCNDIDAMLKMEGLIKCRILPPIQLYHHVLPFRHKYKLFFCLCRSCPVELKTETECMYNTVAERALRFTLVMDDVRIAVKKAIECFWCRKCMNIEPHSTIPNWGRPLCAKHK